MSSVRAIAVGTPKRQRARMMSPVPSGAVSIAKRPKTGPPASIEVVQVPSAARVAAMMLDASPSPREYTNDSRPSAWCAPSPIEMGT